MEARRRRRGRQETTRKATVEELARPVVGEPFVTSFGKWAIILGAFGMVDMKRVAYDFLALVREHSSVVILVTAGQLLI